MCANLQQIRSERVKRHGCSPGIIIRHLVRVTLAARAQSMSLATPTLFHNLNRDYPMRSYISNARAVAFLGTQRCVPRTVGAMSARREKIRAFLAKL